MMENPWKMMENDGFFLGTSMENDGTSMKNDGT